MPSKPLVSIITPCYNSEPWIERYLDSVCNQTYKHIQLICVDDGSTDSTAVLIKSYEKRFNKFGIELVYIYQQNQGLGGAINSGLKRFTGDFLCWADPDDFFDKTSVEKRLKFLINNPQYGIVSSNAFIWNSNNMIKNQGYIDTNKIRFEPNQFHYLLQSKSLFCSGCHMVRKSAFLDVNPSKAIFPARRGQNWQMLLPIYYKYQRGFIDEGLYNYVIYENSMSKGDNTIERCLERIYGFKEILNEVLQNMQMDEVTRIKSLNYVNNEKIPRHILSIAFAFDDDDLFFENYLILKKNNIVTKNDKYLYHIKKHKLIYILYKLLLKNSILVKAKRVMHKKLFAS